MNQRIESRVSMKPSANSAYDADSAATSVTG
jgi:hypothetical protein